MNNKGKKYPSMEDKEKLKEVVLSSKPKIEYEVKKDRINITQKKRMPEAASEL